MFGFELGLARCEARAQSDEIHLGFAGFGEHAARFFFLPNVMLDHLTEHIDLCSEVIIPWRQLLDFGYQLFRRLMLDFRLVVDVPILGR
jgi:hypothetical protein